MSARKLHQKNNSEREILERHGSICIHSKPYPPPGASQFRGRDHDDIHLVDKEDASIKAKVKGAGAPPTRLQRELVATKRAISLARLTEFQRQCDRLAHLVADGVIGRADAADELFEAAQANDLVDIHGVDCIQRSLAAAFARAPLGSALKGRAA